LRSFKETDADHSAVIFDAAGHSFRNRLYDQYKANRGPSPDDLVPQFALMREATHNNKSAASRSAD
jgi:DNA polymerase-1